VIHQSIRSRWHQRAHLDRTVLIPNIEGPHTCVLVRRKNEF